MKVTADNYKELKDRTTLVFINQKYWWFDKEQRPDFMNRLSLTNIVDSSKGIHVEWFFTVDDPEEYNMQVAAINYFKSTYPERFN